MKKYLHIPIALLLIFLGIWGCTLHRSRPLLACFPTDDWTAVSGTQRPDTSVIITPDQLKEAVDGVSVRPCRKFSLWDCETVFLQIQAEDRTVCAEIGANGGISIWELGDPEGARTCWRAEDAVLYETLLDFCQP